MGDAELSAAVDEHERDVVIRLEVDWGRDGNYAHTLSDVTAWVTDLTVERSATGDLPAEVALVEGSIAATLTATLGGLDPDTGLELTGTDGLSALETFAPYRADSPLYQQAIIGCAVRCDIGLATDTGVELRRQFTGHLRALAPDSRSREVTLSAIDGAGDLRAPITVPAFAMYYGDMLASNHRVACNSQAVIDFVFRRNGYYASPAARDDAQISCTGHGWLVAETGRSAVPRGVAAVITDDSWFLLDPDHPWGMLCVRGVWPDNGLYQEFFAEEPFAVQPGDAVGFSMWVKFGTGMTDLGAGPTYRPLIQLGPCVDGSFLFEAGIFDDGNFGAWYLQSSVYTGNGIGSANVGAHGWRYVGAHWTINLDDTITIRWRVDGAGFTQSFAAPGPLTSSLGARLQATVWCFRHWTNLQVWFGEAGTPTWVGETHTATASIDVGLGYLLHLPDVVEQESLQVLTDVVGAEFGLVGFDEDGNASFTAHASSTDPTTVDKTVTADRALLDLASEVNMDAVRNVVSAETVMGTMRWPVTVLDAQDEAQFDAGVGVTHFDVPLEWGRVGTTTQTIPRVASASWADTVTGGFVSVQAASPTTEITSGVSVTAAMTDDRMIRITIRNFSSWPVRFATTSGSPALRVPGWGIVLDPARIDRVRSQGSIDLYGERSYKIDASPWRQYWPPLQTIAGGLLATLSNPMPVLRNVPIVGDPLIGIGHVIRFEDEQGQGSFRAYTVGVRQQVERGALRTELTARPIGPPGLGLLDDTELGILDSTLVLAP